MASPSAFDMMPCRASIAACAADAATSCSISRRSTSTETLIAAITAEGPAAKRPPQIGLTGPAVAAGWSSLSPAAPGTVEADGDEGMSARTFGLVLAAVILLSAAPFASGAPKVTGTNVAACSEVPPTLAKFRPASNGAMLPAAPFVQADGAERPLAELRGRGLVLNFWATWCAPCVKEMPSLDRLASQAEARELQVLALSADREGAPVVSKFYAANGIVHLPVALDRTGRAARALGVSGLPTTVLFDADGREVGRLVGIAEWDAPSAVDFLATCLTRRG